jgi:hypothetical protein
MNAVVTANQDVQLTIRCKAFSNEGVRSNKVLVKASGDVLVWDSIAGHYTTCHAMSDATQARIRKQALHSWKMSHFHGI